MRVHETGTPKKNIFSNLLLSLGLAVMLGAAVETFAQSQSDVARRQTETGITTYYYGHKSNAVGKLNAEQKRGKYARMYYDNARRQWAVDVSNSLTTGTSRPMSSPSSAPNDTTASTPQTGSYIYYYGFKSNAEGKLKAEKNRGKNARMFYDNGRRKWAVEVGNDLPTGNSAIRPTPGSPRPETTNSSADGGNLPNGASIIYFPTKASAEGIYKASLRQGDWARMWYDAKRREWAVAVKPRL